MITNTATRSKINIGGYGYSHVILGDRVSSTRHCSAHGKADAYAFAPYNVSGDDQFNIFSK